MNIYKKNLGEYIDLIKLPVVFLLALSIVQFIVRVLAYFLGNSIVRILGWITFAFMEFAGLAFVIYISYVAVRKKKWSALSTLILGLLFGFITGLISFVGFAFGNVIALILATSPGWNFFKLAAWTGVSMVFLPLIKCVLGGFIAGIVGVIFEKD